MKDKTILELVDDINSNKTTSREVFDFFLGRIDKFNWELNAFTNISRESFDDSWDYRGIPIWIKDNISEDGVLTSAGSKMLADFKPPYDATVISKLKSAWFSSIWKTNMDEFAMGSMTDTSIYGATKNPYNTLKAPGWSSGWSARWVASGLVPARLWTDTGWSVRIPASMCGVVGFKPTYGRISRVWVIPMAGSFDTAGFLTKNVYDSALLYDITNWNDKWGYSILEWDDTTLEWVDNIDFDTFKDLDLTNLKIWLPTEFFDHPRLDGGIKDWILEIVDELRSRWVEFVDVSIADTELFIPTYYTIMSAEVTTNLARLDGVRYGHTSNKDYQNLDEFYINNRSEWFGEEAKLRSLLGSYFLLEDQYKDYYQKATKIRTKIIDDTTKLFANIDFILSPTSPSIAPNLDSDVDYFDDNVYTILANLTWNPAISIPAWLVDGMPYGLQLMWNFGDDARLLEASHQIEQAIDFKSDILDRY